MYIRYRYLNSYVNRGGSACCLPRPKNLHDLQEKSEIFITDTLYYPKFALLNLFVYVGWK